ncbi:MAG: helix-turn-helix domain-containing protein [Desulfobacter sp.]
MTADKKLAHKKLTLPQLAEKLGNVSRSQFYDYKRSFQEFGLEGLVDKTQIPVSHSNKVPDDYPRTDTVVPVL